MSVFFGGLPCRDPVAEAQSCQARGWPVAPWWGRANGYRCPLGRGPGRGVLLMARGDAATLSATALYPLEFCDGANVVTLPSLLFVRGRCVTPGARGDPAATYAVEIADKRFLARAAVIDAAYNLRSNAGAAPSCYLSATLNAGVAWTWTQTAQALWAAVGTLGAWPGLPFTPDGTPEGFNFYGGNAYDALNDVLERVGCALAYNPITDAYRIIEYGAADAVNAAALGLRDGARLWDADPLESARGRLPQYLRVHFPVQRATPDATGASPFYHLDLTDPTAGGPLPDTQAGSYAAFHDDLAAAYDVANTLTNAAALASRAADRAADYFRQARVCRLERAYDGCFPDAGLLPGPQLRAVRWIDRGRGDGVGAGLVTEAERWPEAEGAWPEEPPRPPGTALARRVLSDGTVGVRPTGPGEGDTLVLSSAGVVAVNNVCPVFGTASAPGGGTVQVVTGIVVQYVEPDGSIFCNTNPVECCPGSGTGTGTGIGGGSLSPCCVGENESSLCLTFQSQTGRGLPTLQIPLSYVNTQLGDSYWQSAPSAAVGVYFGNISESIWFEAVCGSQYVGGVLYQNVWTLNCYTDFGGGPDDFLIIICHPAASAPPGQYDTYTCNPLFANFGAPNVSGGNVITMTPGPCSGGGGGGGGGGITDTGLGTAAVCTSASTLTMSGVAVAAKSLLVVNVGVGGGHASGVTFNGVALTLAEFDQTQPDSCSIWYLTVMAATTGNIVVTAAAPAATIEMSAVQVSGLTSITLFNENAQLVAGTSGHGSLLPSLASGVIGNAPTYIQAAFFLTNQLLTAWASPFTDGGQDASACACAYTLTEGFDLASGTGSVTAAVSTFTNGTCSGSVKWAGAVACFF